jgi:hypothetical protein
MFSGLSVLMAETYSINRKILDVTVTNQNYICEEIRSVLSLENALCCLVQSPLSSCLLTECVMAAFPGFAILLHLFLTFC